MFRPRIIPCLLLSDKGLVKTVQFSHPTYVGDPINAVKIFNEARSDEIIFLDINASKNNTTPNLDLIGKIGDEAFMPFAVGGGIKDLNDVKNIILAGAEKVVLNSICFNKPELISQAAEVYGSQSVVCSVDIKKTENNEWTLFSNGGTKQEKAPFMDHVRKLEALGAGEIFINSIDCDGTMNGYDLEAIRMVCQEVSVPVIACGGAQDVEDMAQMIRLTGASAGAAGSVFVFIGSKRAVLINYPEPEELFELFEDHE